MFGGLTVNHKGFILIEVMMSAALGLVITLFLFNLYLTSQNNFTKQNLMHEIQNHKAVIIQILTSEIKRAGDIGCPKLTNHFQVVPYQQYDITYKNKISINQDRITVRHASLSHTELIKPMMDPSTLIVANHFRFKKNNILIISDCVKAEIFQVKEVSKQLLGVKITSKTPLHALFDVNAEIANFEINRFDVEHSSLFMTNIDNEKLRLVDGVNAIQFEWITEKVIKVIVDLYSGQLHKMVLAYAASTT